MSKVLMIYIIGINLMTFGIYGWDKKKAQKGRYRIPEKTLIGLALAGGSIGAYLGMQWFSHKTRKAKFYLGIPLILVAQVVLLVWLVQNSVLTFGLLGCIV